MSIFNNKLMFRSLENAERHFMLWLQHGDTDGNRNDYDN